MLNRTEGDGLFADRLILNNEVVGNYHGGEVCEEFISNPNKNEHLRRGVNGSYSCGLGKVGN